MRNGNSLLGTAVISMSLRLVKGLTDVDVDVEDKEDVLVVVVVMLVEQHWIIIKERQIQTVMNRLRVVEMEIGVPSMDEVLVAECIHLVADCSGCWHCLLGLYMDLLIRIV
jgi:hypothetical protein